MGFKLRLTNIFKMFRFLSIHILKLEKIQIIPDRKNLIFMLISNSVIRAKGKVMKKVVGKIP
jgi:hypothetical protein